MQPRPPARLPQHRIECRDKRGWRSTVVRIRPYSLGSICSTGVSEPSMAALRTRMSSASHRSEIASASFAMESLAVRSRELIVALPPPCGCGPRLLRALAVAPRGPCGRPRRRGFRRLPMPRLAPVTSATFPANGFVSVIGNGELSAGDERERSDAVLLGHVGQAGRIFAGEAGIALRLVVVAFAAERTIEPLDRDVQRGCRR